MVHSPNDALMVDLPKWFPALLTPQLLLRSNPAQFGLTD